MAYNDCMHSREDSWELTDVHGIYVARVCDKCEVAVRNQYDPQIFGNVNYHVEAGETLGNEDE